MRRVMFDARVLALWNAVVDVWFAWVSGQLGELLFHAAGLAAMLWGARFKCGLNCVIFM